MVLAAAATVAAVVRRRAARGRATNGVGQTSMTEHEAPQPIEGEPAAASQGVEETGTNSEIPIADKDSDYQAGRLFL